MAKGTKKTKKTVAVTVKGRTIEIPQGLSVTDGEQVLITAGEGGDDPRDVGEPRVYGEEVDQFLEKRLVAVGINQYRDPRINDLTGCVSDATSFSQKLNKDFAFSFDADHFRFLTDDAATKANIIRDLTWLVTETGPYDVGVFYYSGHGSQVPDQAPPDNDEADGLDEVIVPSDTNLSAANPIATIIRDDEIARILANVNADAHFVVVFDSCHSGTGTRPVQIVDRGWHERVTEVSRHATNLKTLFANATKSGLQGPHPLAGSGHLLLAAAHASQVSWEFGGKGVFTKHLVANLTPGRTYADVMRTVIPLVDTEVVQAEHVHQVPEIDGGAALQNNPLFAIVI